MLRCLEYFYQYSWLYKKSLLQRMGCFVKLSRGIGITPRPHRKQSNQNFSALNRQHSPHPSKKFQSSLTACKLSPWRGSGGRPGSGEALAQVAFLNCRNSRSLMGRKCLALPEISVRFCSEAVAAMMASPARMPCDREYCST